MASNFIQKQKKQTPKEVAGDDRNLVLVDDDFQDADFEDKVWLLWKRHGKRIVAGAVLVFILGLAAIIYTQSQKMIVDALQEEYAACEKTPEARLAFAEKNSSKPMAGTVFYALANEAFEAKKFDEAAKLYEKAYSVFSEHSGEDFPMIRDRAAMGTALSFLRAGSKTAARERFVKLAETLTTDETIRGQAMYNLAVLAIAEKDLPSARKWLDEMDRALSPVNVWRYEKEKLLGLVPELISEA